MTSPESRVAIYIDFDNVVISRASQVKETGASATVAIDVLLDFATRYGRLTISRVCRLVGQEERRLQGATRLARC
jgi:hypothetical protein